jgi:hypothetical protein
VGPTLTLPPTQIPSPAPSEKPTPAPTHEPATLRPTHVPSTSSRPTLSQAPTPAPSTAEVFNDKWTLEGTFNCLVTQNCPSSTAVSNGLWRVLQGNLTNQDEIIDDDFVCHVVRTINTRGKYVYTAYSYFEIEVTRTQTVNDENGVASTYVRYPSYSVFEQEVRAELEGALGSRLWVAGCASTADINDLYIRGARRYPTLLPTTHKPSPAPTRWPTAIPSSTPVPSPLPTRCEDASWFCKDLIGDKKPGKAVDNPDGFCTTYFCDGLVLGVKGQPCTHAGFCDLSW